MMESKLVVDKTLDMPPSCIEVSPRHRDYFLVGTYRLRDNDGSSRDSKSLRDGSIVSYRRIEQNA